MNDAKRPNEPAGDGGAKAPRLTGPALVDALVATLPSGVPGLFNPWVDVCAHSCNGDGPQAKRERLAHHLDCDPLLILVGEAPGYQGCRYSGVAFSSERLLLAGEIPRVPRLDHRITDRRLPFSEPSATIVWNTLRQHGVAERTILWNALQLHPHNPAVPWGNRTPSDAEIKQGTGALKLLRATFPKAKIVAVGRKAELAFALCGLTFDAAVRHPANGGAVAFEQGIGRALAAFRAGA